MTSFTPAQIQEILDIFFDNFAHRQYTGQRYVPIFGRKDENSIEWDNTKPYEPLTIVLYEGNSYTSRQFTPAGISITNTDYWAITGNYNAQIELYRQEVSNIADIIPANEFDSVNTVKKAIDDLYNLDYIRYVDADRYVNVNPTKLCVLDIPSNRTIAACAYNSDDNTICVGTFVDSNTLPKIYVFDYDDIIHANGSETISSIDSYDLSVNSHINSMCYYSGKLYICAWLDLLNTSRRNAVNIYDISNETDTTVALPQNVDFESMGIFNGSDGALTLIGFLDHLSHMQQWKIIDENVYPFACTPVDIISGTMSQDIHATDTFAYRLLNKLVNGKWYNTITVNDYYGNTLYECLIGDKIPNECEGITKKSGTNPFIIVDSEAIVYKTETYDFVYQYQYKHDSYAYAKALHDYQTLIANSQDFPSAYTIETNTASKKITTEFTMPARRYTVRGCALRFIINNESCVEAVIGQNNILFVDYFKFKTGSPDQFIQLHMEYTGVSTNIGTSAGKTVYTLTKSNTYLKIGDTEYTGETAFNNIPFTVYTECNATSQFINNFAGVGTASDWS